MFADTESFTIRNYRSHLSDTHYDSGLQIKESPGKLFEYLRTNLSKNLRGKDSYYNFLNMNGTQAFLFIVDTRSFTRNLEGEFNRLFRDNFSQSFSIIPASIASKQKIYQTTRSNIIFQNLEEEF